MSDAMQPTGTPGRTANLDVAAPAAVVVAALLAVLAFDFARGGEALGVHVAAWAVGGLLIALVVAAIVRRWSSLPLAVLAGAVLGVGVGALVRALTGGGDLLLAAGA